MTIAYEPLKVVFFISLHFSGIIMSFPASVHTISDMHVIENELVAGM